MIFLILGVIIGIILLIGYIIQLNRTIKVQHEVIEEQIYKIDREIDSHKRTKSILDLHVKAYNQVVDQIHQLSGIGVNTPVKVTEYDMDEILKEISVNGIKNVSQDKLDYLRKFGKNDTDKGRT